jgi:hypothetical protein
MSHGTGRQVPDEMAPDERLPAEDVGPRAAPLLAARQRGATRVMFVVALVLAAAPLVVDGAHALHSGWKPAGDEAFVVLRVHDVFTGHTPTIGMPAGTAGDKRSSHLGPLEFWLLAVPYRLSGRSPAGIVLGVAALSVAWVVAIGLVARRLGGPIFGIASLVVTAWLVLALGPGIAHTPFNPTVGLLPLALLVLMVAAVTRGDLVLLPGVAFVASWVAQAHLSYLGITAVLVLCCGAGALAAMRRMRRSGQGRTVGHVALATAGVLAVCWSGPFVDQVSGGGGNLVHVLRNQTRPAHDVSGTAFGLDLTAQVAGWPPPWGLRAHPQVQYEVSHRRGIARLLPLAGMIIVSSSLAAYAIGRRRRRMTLALTTGLLALAAGAFSVSRAPAFVAYGAVRVIGWNVSALWPIAASFWILVLLALTAMKPRWARDTPMSLAVLTTSLVLIVAICADRSITTAPDVDMSAITQISGRLQESLPKKGTYRLAPDYPSIRVAAGVVATLESQGFRFAVDSQNPTVAKLFTSPRLDRGQPVLGTVFVTQEAGRTNDPAQRQVLVRFTGSKAGPHRTFEFRAR